MDEAKTTVAGAAPDVLATLPKTVALVGLMGAGKSSVGRRLALALGVPFRDADDEIEKAARQTVSEIFAEHGEAEFRRGERRVISRLLDDPPHILATGGGAFMDPETRAIMVKRAVTVWLRADLDTLMRRVSRRDDRPLLKTPNPRATMESLMVARYPIYAEANIIVDSRDGPHTSAVDAILAILRKWPR